MSVDDFPNKHWGTCSNYARWVQTKRCSCCFERAHKTQWLTCTSIFSVSRALRRPITLSPVHPWSSMERTGDEPVTSEGRRNRFRRWRQIMRKIEKFREFSLHLMFYHAFFLHLARPARLFLGPWKQQMLQQRQASSVSTSGPATKKSSSSTVPEVMSFKDLHKKQAKDSFKESVEICSHQNCRETTPKYSECLDCGAR